MVALNGMTGAVLWKFPSGGSVIDGPSLVDGTLYSGSGYKNFGIGTGNNKLYAFSLPRGSGWRWRSRFCCHNRMPYVSIPRHGAYGC